MTIPFSLRHAARELRSGVRRIGWFLAAIAMGVAALVALYGFQRDAGDSARTEARAILGGDARLDAPAALDARTLALLDSLRSEGATVSRGVSLASLVVGGESGVARLLQVNAVDDAFPAVGRPVESAPGVRRALQVGGGVVADPQVFRQLRVAPGERVRLGTRELVALGSIAGLPVDLEVQFAVGPPIYMALTDLEESDLLGFGSLAQHRAWVVFPDADGAGRFEERYEDELRDLGVSIRTADEEARSLEAGFEELARFLGLVGLAALVLGGIGVGSATSVYLAERRPAIAVLRCLGASRGTVLRAYLLQSAALGLVGGLLGVVAGAAAQLSLPTVLESVLPFTITPRLRPEGMAAGLLIGAWVSIAFALLPLLELHAVPPVAALRAAPEGGKARVPFATAAVALGVGASVFGVAWIQIGEPRAALVVTLGLAGVFALLGAIGWGIAQLVRVALPLGAPFPLRQGLSGLFRPGNQTGAVVTTLGLGAFLVGALLVVESGLRAELDLNLGADQPSLVLFDIQEGQVEGIRSLLRSEGLPEELVPIVPARLAAVGGTAVSDLMASREGPTWMYRRVYRNTYYERVGDAEEVLEGRWWGSSGDDPPRVAEAVAAGAVRVSIDRDLALDLGITVGDRITWDVQGVPVESVVASLRAVEWASFRPNFFAVFEPGAMDRAPKTFVALAAPADPAAGERIQRGVVDGFPNVSFLDVSLVRETLERIAGQVTLVLRSMAAFVLAAGAVVLLASLLTSRFRRRRESALLKALGASGRTIRRVLLSEYGAIGAVAGGAGVLLAGVGGRLLLDWRFGLAGGIPWGTLLGLWVGVLVLAVAAGWSVSGPVLRATPISVLREEGG